MLAIVQEEPSNNDNVSPFKLESEFLTDEQNNAMTENVGETVNCILATEISEIPEDSGRSKRKRVPRHVADTLNGCLCGMVLNGSVRRVLQCKQAGCETQWVSIQIMGSSPSRYSRHV